ncbi:hypothetical protein NAT51_05110 [Flavobacterium amniphilum]|uniref:hypothetical protein n=1 Tax=Flavobacterium amniphilum TaxID=1834035 RepID=UPI00202AAD49|nr:hypothetical protein [Flavobacterium amniphilum]MCL9804887.1 hypothetical protein [Flavobacterium amniphilum]
MTVQELQIFIDHYSARDFDRIKLIWNGKYGEDFADENYDFRVQVCELAVSRIDTVPIELIRDLYLETGKTSPMTFGVYNKFHLLADELLKRGGKEYLLDYIRGASHSMDTGMSSGRLTLSKESAKELLDYFDELKSASTNPEEQKLLNDLIRNRLELISNRVENRDNNPSKRKSWWGKLFGL